MSRKLITIVLILFHIGLFILPALAEEGDLKTARHFDSYQQLFSYIADENGLGTDPQTILKLAADSRVEYLNSTTKDGPLRAIITANWINTQEFAGVNSLRGASNNGLFYVVQFSYDGLQLIGILEGNGFKSSQVNGQEVLITSWHMSANEYVQTIYEWDGNVFKKKSSRTVVEP